MDWLRSSRYKREGIDVGGMTFEDNSEVVALIEATPNGLLPLLGEECFFPNASDASWLLKIKQAHKKHPCFSEDRQNKDAFTISHYPGKVTYESKGFLMKNKDPLSQDLKVLMQFSDDEFVADIFKEEEQPGKRFKSAKFVGVIDNFRKSLTALVATLGDTKTHFIRCVKPNEVKKPHTFVESVMMRQLYTSGVVQAVAATRKGFPDHLTFDELLNRFILVVPGGGKNKGKTGVADLLKAAGVDTKQYRIGHTKVFLGVGVLDKLEQARMNFIAEKAVMMQGLARMHIAKQKLRALKKAKAEEERKKREAEEEKRKAEEAKKRAEEEARKKKEEEERIKAEEEAAKKKEAEEKDRQERFRRARQLSFERKTAKKKREEKEKKQKAEEEAAAAKEAAAMSGSVAAAKAALDGKSSENLLVKRSSSVVDEEQKPSEEYVKKLDWVTPQTPHLTPHIPLLQVREEARSVQARRRRGQRPGQLGDDERRRRLRHRVEERHRRRPDARGRVGAVRLQVRGV